MKNADYWKKRSEILEEARHGEAEAYATQLAREYDKYASRTKADIDRWYQRLADNNDLSLAGAHKLLKADELDEFKWTVEDYIKAGRENAVDQRWMKQLENASAKYHISRLEAARTEMQQQVEMLAAGQERGMTRLLSGVYTGAYGQTAFEIQKGIGVGFGIDGVDPRAVSDLIRKPWMTDKRSFSDRIWTNKVDLLTRLQTDLTQAVMRGDNPKTLASGIAKEFDVSKYKAERLVLTEAAYFGAQGQKDAYKELGVEAVEFVATLDHRTSAICQSMDGQIIAMKDYEPGVTAPPLHPFCRSTTAPWFDDDFTEVGYRASRDEAGKTVYEVPADMTYPEWAEQFMGSNKNRDTMAGMGERAPEYEKKSRKNKPTSVNWDVVKSPEYKNRFDGITGDADVDALLHTKALDMLEHRNNTEFEDMYLIGLDTKKVEGTQTHSNTILTVNYNASLRSAISRASPGALVSIHNHPNSKPPSGADLESNHVRGYNTGVIACHNGDIYVYKTGKIRISSDLFDMRLEKFKKPPYNMIERDAYLYTLQSMERDYGVKWERR